MMNTRRRGSAASAFAAVTEEGSTRSLCGPPVSTTMCSKLSIFCGALSSKISKSAAVRSCTGTPPFVAYASTRTRLVSTRKRGAGCCGCCGGGGGGAAACINVRAAARASTKRGDVSMVRPDPWLLRHANRDERLVRLAALHRGELDDVVARSEGRERDVGGQPALAGGGVRPLARRDRHHG